MKLMVILIALGLERYFQLGDKLKRFTHFETLLMVIQDFLPIKHLSEMGLGFLLPLPFVLIFALLYVFLGLIFNGVLQFFLAVFTLLYCLGPKDLFAEVHAYFTLSEQSSAKEAIQAAQMALIGTNRLPKEAGEIARALTKAICLEAHRRQFTIVFFYILLGPLGLFALLYYRLLTCLEALAAKPDGFFKPILLSLSRACEIMDFIPSRLTLLLYGFMGNFMPVFRYVLSKLTQFDLSNTLILSEGALLALDLQPSDFSHADISENKMAFYLVERAMGLLLFFVTIFTLGAWIS